MYIFACCDSMTLKFIYVNYQSNKLLLDKLFYLLRRDFKSSVVTMKSHENMEYEIYNIFPA